MGGVTGRAKITAAHRASDTDQVLSVVGGRFAYRRTPCAGCPWRVDQTGKFSAEAFRISAHTAYDAAFETFGCHESGPDKPAICAGFLLRNSVHNLGARLKGIAGGAGCHSQVELHRDYRTMAIANGVSPSDPALVACRADDERAPIVHDIALATVCYRVELLADDVIALVDENYPVPSGRTLTNDAEAVIADLARARLLDRRRVIYRDSDGFWDEMLVRGGRFVGFAPIRRRNLAHALRLVRDG